MNIFLFCIGVVIIFTGGAYLLTVDEIRDIILAIVIMVFGVILSMVSMLNKTEEVYKLTITDTKTKEITYEIVTDIEEYENYLKFLSNKRIISIVEKINYQCGRRTMKQKKIKILIFLFNVREGTKRTLE